MTFKGISGIVKTKRTACSSEIICFFTEAGSVRDWSYPQPMRFRKRSSLSTAAPLIASSPAKNSSPRPSIMAKLSWICTDKRRENHNTCELAAPAVTVAWRAVIFCDHMATTAIDKRDHCRKSTEIVAAWQVDILNAIVDKAARSARGAATAFCLTGCVESDARKRYSAGSASARSAVLYLSDTCAADSDY